MSETLMLTAAFLFVGTPLYIAVAVLGAEQVRAGRHTRLLRRGGK